MYQTIHNIGYTIFCQKKKKKDQFHHPLVSHLTEPEIKIQQIDGIIIKRTPNLKTCNKQVPFLFWAILPSHPDPYRTPWMICSHDLHVEAERARWP
jgi:hypothetical protein